MNRIEELQEKINRTIAAESFHGKPAELFDPIVYSMSMGGKRLRPTLTLLACEMFGGKLEEALHPAIAIEIFHNFTLLHDDIMDKSPLRRSNPTVWKKWNENIAILSGDTMLIMAYDYLMKTQCDCLIEILGLFNKTATEVCQGQQLDMNFESQGKVGIEDYLEMIRLKTAVLVASSLKTGAIIAQTTSVNANLVYKFGENTGIAFQLMDDYLDVFGVPDKFGKLTGNDILTNKKTWLYLKAFELAGDLKKAELQAAFAIQDPYKKVETVTSLYRTLGVDQLTLDAINGYHEKAILNLEQIQVAPEKKSDLRNFSLRLIHREN